MQHIHVHIRPRWEHRRPAAKLSGWIQVCCFLLQPGTAEAPVEGGVSGWSVSWSELVTTPNSLPPPPVFQAAPSWEPSRNSRTELPLCSGTRAFIHELRCWCWVRPLTGKLQGREGVHAGAAPASTLPRPQQHSSHIPGCLGRPSKQSSELYGFLGWTTGIEDRTLSLTEKNQVQGENWERCLWALSLL
jgi:hypothetical protein